LNYYAVLPMLPVYDPCDRQAKIVQSPGSYALRLLHGGATFYN